MIRVEVYMTNIIVRSRNSEEADALMFAELLRAGIPMEAYKDVPTVRTGTITTYYDAAVDKYVFTWYPPEPTGWQKLWASLKRFW